MKIDYQPQTFKCITLKNGGDKYVLETEGEAGLSMLMQAKQETSDYTWRLNVGENGYALESPTTLKTYNGPFSVKKQLTKFKEGIYRLIVRMDPEKHCVYRIDYLSSKEVYQAFSEFKKSTPLQQVLMLLRGLEKTYRAKK